MNTRIESLQLIESACWRELERAAREREHPWRVMALATVDSTGEGAEARSIVVREVRAGARELMFYADDRSGKVAQIGQHPRGTLLGWSATLGWQLRLRVHVQRCDDGLDTSSRWARLKLSPGAHDYLSPMAPGTPLDAPTHESGSRPYFTVLCARVESMDWLELHAEGHRRAQFDARGARWLQP